MNMEKPLTQESMRMKGSSLSFQQKQLMSKPLTEAHPPQVYLSHTTFFTLTSLFPPPLIFAQIHLPAPCTSTTKKTNLIPTPALPPLSVESGGCAVFPSITLSLLHQHQIGLQPAGHGAASTGRPEFILVLMRTDLPPIHNSAIYG